MSDKCTEDITPIIGTKNNPGKIVIKPEEVKTFTRAIVEGLDDLDKGHEVDLDLARKRLGLC